jgi:hypothetical protein
MFLGMPDANVIAWIREKYIAMFPILMSVLVGGGQLRRRDRSAGVVLRP